MRSAREAASFSSRVEIPHTKLQRAFDRLEPRLQPSSTPEPTREKRHPPQAGLEYPSCLATTPCGLTEVARSAPSRSGRSSQAPAFRERPLPAALSATPSASRAAGHRPSTSSRRLAGNCATTLSAPL